MQSTILFLAVRGQILGGRVQGGGYEDGSRLWDARITKRGMNAKAKSHVSTRLFIHHSNSLPLMLFKFMITISMNAFLIFINYRRLQTERGFSGFTVDELTLFFPTFLVTVIP